MKLLVALSSCIGIAMIGCILAESAIKWKIWRGNTAVNGISKVLFYEFCIGLLQLQVMIRMIQFFHLIWIPKRYEFKEIIPPQPVPGPYMYKEALKRLGEIQKLI